MVGWILINQTRVPARLIRVASAGTDPRPVASSVTHTATIPVTQVAVNSEVTASNGQKFLVISNDIILNKSRLGLKLRY